jgi:protein ImuB
VVATELDPPAEQLQAAVFVGRALAEELHDRLIGSGLICTRLAIEAETEYGTTLRRSWRHDGALSAAAIGERVRWQLEGWALTGQAADQASPGVPTGPAPLQSGPGHEAPPTEQRAEAAQAGRVTRLALVPEEVRPDDGRQLGFWGNDAGTAARAARALARVQGLLGPAAAVTAVLQGGRDYGEQVLFVPWGEPRVPLRPGGQGAAPGAGPAPGTTFPAAPAVAPAGETAAPTGGTAVLGPAPASGGRHLPVTGGRRSLARPPKAKDGPPPWPGRLPGLAPAVVHRSPLAAQVLGPDGDQVTVGSRGMMNVRPTWVVIGTSSRTTVEAWAGPWPLEERWWEAGGRRRARVQVCTADGRAYLLALEKRRWWVEATYD